jgi:ABC-2 type transport system permease protein
MAASELITHRPTGTVRRHLRVARVAFVQALGRDTQFRAQTWTTVVVGLVEVVLGLVPALLVFSRTRQVNGWDLGGVVAVAGMCQVMLAVLGAFVQPNQMKMTDYVRRGELDGVLIRPVSAQWFTACRWMQPSELWSGLAGITLVVLGLHRAGIRPGPVEIIIAIGWFVAGLVLVTLVWMNLGYLAFWLESADPVTDLVLVLLTAGRYPVAFFPIVVRVGLMFVLPVGIATTVPVTALAGERDPVLALIMLGVLVVLAVLTRLHWVVALRRYASASS